MKSRFFGLAILLSIFILLDYYNWGAIRDVTNHHGNAWLAVGYWCISALGITGAYIGITQLSRRPMDRGVLINWLVGFAFVMLIVRLLLAALLVIHDIYRLLVDLFNSDGTVGLLGPRDVTYLIVALVIVSIPFLAMLFGISFGKYRYRVEHLTLEYPDLPKAFEGFKLVQISDVHAGSWDNISKVEAGLQLLQEQHGDVILFTGDLVNSNKDEIDPFIEVFEKLHAPYGKYAVLGNHDYYGQPREAALRPAYYEDFFSKFERMGWDLILNDSRKIEKDGQLIKLIGVENWGEGRYFPKRGDLDQALQEVASDDFSILLSHDPTHWDHKVKNHSHHVHLTLSGHTHGMQFGINLKWLRWSPVKYRYKKWIGKYLHNDQVLYINRGFGYLGFPGRVGMWPEITVITLRHKK